MKTRKIAVTAIAAATAMILSYLESLIPLSLSFPGIKIGLANLAIVFILYKLGIKEAVCVSVLRLLWVGILFGNMMTLAYSAAGAALSLAVMALLRKTNKFSEIGVSVAGGVFHNFGQILMAALLMGVAQILYYLPVLCISGTISGAIIGIVGGVLIKRIPWKK